MTCGRRELLLGAGTRRTKLIYASEQTFFTHLVTCDIEPSHDVDVVCDLEQLPWPFEDESFDEVHAYEILEHLGSQGDYKAFFAHFAECWRILKPGGVLAATVPSWNGIWAFSDPGHRRIISEGTLAFLDQDEYTKQIGNTPMSDYRAWWPPPMSFKPLLLRHQQESFLFALRKEGGDSPDQPPE